MALTYKHVRGIIETHQAKSRKTRTEWDRWRRWYLSDFWDIQRNYPTGSVELDSLGTETTFETNYPYAYIDTMVANVCPSNPSISVMARRKKNKDAAKYREALANDSFRRNRLHESIWKLATQTAIYGRGFLKSVWNFRRESVEYINVDPRYVFFDMSASRWEDIRYCIEVTVLTKAEFEKRVKKPGKKGGTYKAKVADLAMFGGYPTWLLDNVRDKSLMNEASQDVFSWVTVYEFYDFIDNKYYHCLHGVDEPLFEDELPYRFVRNPFVQLTFNDNLMDLGGMSDVQLISSLQQRLNELDTLELWHAQSSIPVLLLQSGLVDNPEAFKTALLDVGTPGCVVDVHGKADAPLRDLIGQTPVPALSPSWDKMRDRATQVIEFVLGIPQYSRGVVGVTDIATEVALADSATRTRNGRRIKAVNDIVVSLAEATVGLYEEFLEEDSVLPIRLTDRVEALEVTRASILAEEGGALSYDYEASAYSPTENNRLTQLKNVQAFLPILAQAPNVDQEALFAKLLELLQMKDVMKEGSGEDAAMAMQQMAQQQQGGAPATDTIATGALPPGVQEPQVPNNTGGAGFPVPNPSTPEA